MNWRRVSHTAGLCAVGIGALGFLGWLADVEALKRIHPAWVTMKANTALSLMLAGMAAALLQNENLKGLGAKFVLGAAAAVFAVGLITLGEHLQWWSTGLDQLLFKESLEQAGRSFPGRMGPASAVNFMLLGAALISLHWWRRRGSWVAQSCALAVVAVTFVVFLTYFYQVEIPHDLEIYLSIAFHTVIAFLLLAASLLLARPEHGLMKVVLSDEMSGVVARRMLPAALLLPGSIGWLCTLGRNAGYYGRGVGTAILATVLTILFTGLVWWVAKALAAVDERRRKALEELQRSEQYLSDFFENSAMPLHWLGPDGVIQRVNDAELKLLGYSREEYVGRHISEFYADKEASDDILAQLGRGETLVDYPARMLCKDGSVCDVLIHSSVYTKEGKFIHTRCFTRDTTALKQAEAVRNQLAAIVRSSSDAIVSKGLDGIVASWNRGAERIFGYTSEEMIGQSITRIIPPDRLQEEVEIISRLRKGEEIDHYETVRLAKDGRLLNVSLSISPMRNDAGEIMGASKIARDITQRKSAEAALHEQREWFKVTLSSIGDAVIATDAQGMVIFMNPVAEAMTGWNMSDAEGHPLPEVFHIVNESTRQPVENPIERVLREGIVVGLANHTALLSRDGREMSIDDSAAPIRDSSGKLVGAVMVFHDVTDRRRSAEELSQARDAAEAASRAKDDFLAVLSHELRTPLTPALASVSALQALPTIDEAELRESLAIIRRNIELEARLVDDLLDVTRITRGKLRIQESPVEVHVILGDAVAMTRTAYSEKNITLTMKLTEERMLVRGDAVRLTQVFSNLLSNAAKFTAEGGQVTIRTATEAGRARIEVEDTGIGIPREVMPRIFDPFRQGDASTARLFGGLGLGLSVAKGFVEAHGGVIHVHSAGRGRGATFTVVLPRTEGEAAPAVAAAPPTQVRRKGRPVRVLLVEDHDDTREILHRMIARDGHTVTSAGTVTAARKAISENIFDIMLCDLGLPDGTGLDVVRALREKSSIPAIAMSGFGMQADLERSRDAGFSCHMIKPVGADRLRDLLFEMTSSSSAESA